MSISASPPAETEGILQRLEREQPVVTLPISSLVAADSPRFAGVNDEHVHALAELEDLPPILVSRETLRVIDGMHRVKAALLSGRSDIRARFFEGSQEDAFLLAVEANVAHGLPLTLAERRAAAERIIQTRPMLSDRAIAKTTGLAAKTVAAIRRRATDEVSQSNARVGLDGRVRPLNTAAGRRRASELIASRPDVSLRVIAREAGISLGTARDVRERVRAGKDPVPQARHGRVQGARVEADRVIGVQPGVAVGAEFARHGARPAASGTSSASVEAKVKDAKVEDARAILEGLFRDPSLRYTESGRTLLRWLNQRVAAPGEWRAAVKEMPPHCGVVVERIARACAAFWMEVADEMESLDGQAAPG